MKTHLFLTIFLMITWAQIALGQEKSLLLTTHLNTKTGKAIEGVSISVDNKGNCITLSDGKCLYPNLKSSHNKTAGMTVNINASLANYFPINNLDFKSYKLSHQKKDTVFVIMSLKEEKEKYALAYFEIEIGIIIRKRFEQKEKNYMPKLMD
ncbi:hypothetical protein ABID42_004706 [Arcicella rosea]|uniref:hypothetical protein n=1 Tax=Arcicella rosea TaxID=502909 RepID=UPI00345CD246